MIKEILIATTNKGKLRELKSLFTESAFKFRTAQDIPIFLKVEETGSTYAENALLKASAFCTASGLPTLADDTGLEVEALGGAPGLYSARFSPKPGASDSDRRNLLIEKLRKYPQPWKARFICAMALAHPDGRVFTSEGMCEGEIISKERGSSGFGYDRVFLCAETNCTMTELKTAEKNRVSHRARAADGMRPYIQSIFK